MRAICWAKMVRLKRSKKNHNTAIDTSNKQVTILASCGEYSRQNVKSRYCTAQSFRNGKYSHLAYTRHNLGNAKLFVY